MWQNEKDWCFDHVHITDINSSVELEQTWCNRKLSSYRCQFICREKPSAVTEFKEKQINQQSLPLNVALNRIINPNVSSGMCLTQVCPVICAGHNL